MLKEDSDATVVIGMLKRFLALMDSSENLRLLFFHNSSTSICSKNRKPRFGSSKYVSTWFFPNLSPNSLLHSFNSYYNIEQISL